MKQGPGQHENYLMWLCCQRKHSKDCHCSFGAQPACVCIKREFTKLWKAKTSEGLQMAREKNEVRENGDNQRKAPDSRF